MQFEKGGLGNPLEVTHMAAEPTKSHSKEKPKETPTNLKPNYDFESISAMNQRRQEERKKLIEEIMRKDENACS